MNTPKWSVSNGINNNGIDISIESNCIKLCLLTVEKNAYKNYAWNVLCHLKFERYNAVQCLLCYWESREKKNVKCKIWYLVILVAVKKELKTNSQRSCLRFNVTHVQINRFVFLTMNSSPIRFVWCIYVLFLLFFYKFCLDFAITKSIT